MATEVLQELPVCLNTIREVVPKLLFNSEMNAETNLEDIVVPVIAMEGASELLVCSYPLCPKLTSLCAIFQFRMSSLLSFALSWTFSVLSIYQWWSSTPPWGSLSPSALLWWSSAPSVLSRGGCLLRHGDLQAHLPASLRGFYAPPAQPPSPWLSALSSSKLLLPLHGPGPSWTFLGFGGVSGICS